MTYCCETMKLTVTRSCATHGSHCPDIVMVQQTEGVVKGRFGIPIHDGGSAVISIDFCPWCGTALPGNVPIPTPAEAAQDLARDLRKRGVHGVVCIGERQTPPEVIVYVLRITRALRQAIPSTWMGVTVTMKGSGPVRPAV